MATNTVLYPRGSEWRKWDLQVHTPFSALNNGFGNDFEAYAKDVLLRAFDKKIAVVGMADYFCIEGYKKLRTLLDNRAQLESLVGSAVADYADGMLLLPNVELRTSIIVTDPGGHDSRVNFHVVFSNEVSAEDIEEHFLRELKFTAEGNPNSVDERWSLTPKHLEDLGKKLKAQHATFQGNSDIYIGMMNAVIDHGEVSKTLEEKPSIFRDRYFLFLPCDEDLSKCSWDGQGHLTRKVMIQKSHFLFSSNAGTREFGLGKRHPSTEEFLQEFKTFKPCIHSSDAHCYEDLFEPNEQRYTWVKADPTFEGLEQVFNEPEDRVYIGPRPSALERVVNRSTRVARQVAITKCEDASTTERWFDTHLPLNSELIAVIGNKGSGKSALADILGLLGNTPRYGSFSFLRKERFRDPRNNKASQFEASLTWADDNTEGLVRLDCDPEPDSVEKIKYIPQNYLEEICNEIELGKESRFYAELQQVIFSHVPEAERLGFSTLDELLDYRSEETLAAIEMLASELHELNRQIVSLEERLSPRNRRNLESQLTEKQRELDAHQRAKPNEVSKPDDDPNAQEQSKATSEILEVRNAELAMIKSQIAQLEETDSAQAKRRSTAEKLLTRLENLERQVASATSEMTSDLAELGLRPEQVISIRIDPSPIEGVLKAIDQQRANIATQLDLLAPDSLVRREGELIFEIDDLQKKLSAPELAYQNYLRALREWNLTQAQTVGNVQAVGSLKYLEDQIAKLDELPKDLNRLNSSRNKQALEIFREKRKLRNYYAAYYGAVQEFLASHPIAASAWFKLTFNVTIVQKGFLPNFLDSIDQRKLGPFTGIEEGTTELRRLVDSTNFDSPLGMIRFTRKLLRMMTEHQGRRLDIKEQLAQNISIQEFYDFLFSLRYLAPIYNLEWEGKNLERLSPGERGNLLLIFYLLIDRDDVPLVIDQPEENLDNQTVFNTLVPCVKDAKKRRQIIMVTHNPNLAVVCDAEQVICAEINKDRDNEVVYTSGSIENPIINRKIVDVLEGTRPAFDKRDAKYLP